MIGNIVKVSVSATAISCLSTVWAKGPVLCQTPPLGYNSYDSYSCNIYEDAAMEEIDAMIEKFAPHGYEYFVIDNGWFSSPASTNYVGYLMPFYSKSIAEDVEVDQFGIVQPSKLFFPNGFKPLVDKLHANGLKFGVHLMRGIPRVAVERNLPIKETNYRAKDIYTTKDDCGWCNYMHGVDMTKSGGQEFYNSVFDQFAVWGVDFVKVDDVTHHPAEIEAIVKAIEQCGRPMALSLSPGNDSNVKYNETYRKTAMVRTTPDIWDNEESLERSFNSMRKWQGLEHPGYWPDLDMIPFGELCILKRTDLQKKPSNKTEEQFTGKMHHWCKFTKEQKETFITQRAIAASPIMMGGSMINLDDYSYALLTHQEMLACVKNGIHGVLVHEADGVELWNAPVANTERSGFQEYRYGQGWFALFNRTNEPKSVKMDGKFTRFLPPEAAVYQLTDVWGKQSVNGYKKGSDLAFDIHPQGVLFMKYERVNP